MGENFVLRRPLNSDVKLTACDEQEKSALSEELEAREDYAQEMGNTVWINLVA